MAAGTHWEVESTFDVSAETPLPDLSLDGDLAPRDPVIHRLSATYYDTADLRLTRAKITLRRRTGGKDDGWHVKLPAVETSAGSTGRLELAFPLTESSDVPEEVRRAVYGRVRADALVPIARVDNERHETIIDRPAGDADASGPSGAIAEFCDDHVDGTDLLTGEATSWREWEIELTDAGADDSEDALARLSQACLDAGASPSPLASKLSTTMGPLPAGASAPSSPVGDMLATDVERLLSGDPGTRLGHEVGVHAMRTATRNLLSTLTTYADEIGTAAAARAEDGDTAGVDVPATVAELKTLLRMLGKSRDVYVVRVRLTELADEYSRDLVPDSVRERIDTELGREDERALARIGAAMEDERYLALLDSLDVLVEVASTLGAGTSTDDREIRSGRPKEIVAAGKPASKSEARAMALRGAERQFRRFDKARTKIEDELASLDLTLAQREELTHTLRKRNKALRRSAASISAKTTPQVVPLRTASDRLHTVLGDVQDSVTARQWLRRIARRAEAAGEPTFGFGVLFEHERGASERALEGFADEAQTVSAAFAQLQANRKAARSSKGKDKNPGKGKGGGKDGKSGKK